LKSAQPNRLTVPAEAVIDTGLKKVIFVDRGNGSFEPREIATGERVGERIQVLHGLAAGERIVTSGNFLLNSESQLKSAAQETAAMPDMPGMAAPAKPPAAGAGDARGHRHD
jgi:Cu(I)/Ag(I) efflux system membrane fusion protein